MSGVSFNLLVWNVRGLNNIVKCSLVKESVVSSNASVVCFQESKLEVVDRVTVALILIVLNFFLLFKLEVESLWRGRGIYSRALLSMLDNGR